MSEMIDRVAEAIKVKMMKAAKRGVETPWSEIAKAAIFAMREPTEGMIEEGVAARDRYKNQGQNAVLIWQAMVDQSTCDEKPR